MANEEHLAKLKEGVKKWNEWRNKNSEIIPDLRGSDLISADLRGFDLSRANFSANGPSSTQMIIGITWDVGSQLYGANLSSANLSHANLSGVDLQEADLIGADLSNANLREANLIDADLTEAICVGTVFSEATLTGADFSMAKLIGTDLRNTVLSHAIFTDANLKQANLSGLDLSKVNFTRANLIGANLTRTQAFITDFTAADFTGTCLEDWAFNNTTKFNNIKCRYIYRKSNQQERQPSNREFGSGEFTKLCQDKQEKDSRLYTQTSVRFSATKSDDDNLQEIAKLVDTATIEAVFDPYLDNTALSNILKLHSFGVSISPSIKILTSGKVLKQSNPTLTNTGKVFLS